MIVGVTGTHFGITDNQEQILVDFLVNLKATELHHGDCVGADLTAADFADGMGIKTVCHPPTNPKLRAFHKSTIILPEKPYLDRNRDIVNACGILLVLPQHMYQTVRSGTWATYRYAVKTGRKHVIIWPVYDPNLQVLQVD